MWGKTIVKIIDEGKFVNVENLSRSANTQTLSIISENFEENFLFYQTIH